MYRARGSGSRRLDGLLDRVVAEARLQAQGSPWCGAARPATRSPEDLADFAQGQVLVVWSATTSFSRSGRLSRPRHARSSRTSRGRAPGRARRGPGWCRAARPGRPSVRERPQLIGRDHQGVRDLHERVREVVDRRLEGLGHLGVGRGPVKLVLEARVDALDLACAGAQRARHPVERAQLVDDRALDAGDREDLELNLARRVEALDGGDQAEQGVGDEADSSTCAGRLAAMRRARP
jgi:hypothetical protein